MTDPWDKRFMYVYVPTFILTKTTFHIPYMDPMGKVEIYDDMIKSDDMS